ncbi:hypothetical protein J5N97_015917 [Dioscorea zingiberensis]|uniref:U5 small nuclear ribonucleoprotein 200 kDa helicase n=1 Tax=Dioscorea zingiberensis TaxID=325984 RepID=A0A9D5HF60_9LILI|nr:hypothetical protein J5N97_015917 [Dioscorea zingiberensis]
MLLPVPRLTNSLRGPFDVDQAYLHRKSLLQNRQSKRSKDDLELARKLVPRWDEASSDVRQTYKQFLGALVELINGEISSEEFHEVAKTFYDFFSGCDTDSGDLITQRVIDKKSNNISEMALASEVTSTFGHRLSPLNLTVRELTGDMQLSKNELEETQMIVTTPEKWDVITRKSSDMSLSMLVKLLIIDEVHLLNDDRGSVIEALVARTLRQVESSQSMIRIVGLSATLPNYLEVAQFLRVNPETGLFFFDSSYRPVPLAQQYIGITEKDYAKRNNLYNSICYEKVLGSLKQGHQAMVFVHSHKDTGKTARMLIEIAQKSGELMLFTNEEHPQFGLIKKEVGKSRNREVVELFGYGFGIHHAGMLRADRGLTERLFSDGLLKVLVCTATLAWGVNLPAHTVVIKGTQLYNPKAGGWRDLGMLDVMQIFGRAGRPQFDKSGEGIIITSHDKLAYYLRLLTSQLPIESQFINSLKDNLNAEVALGTVTNVKEACAWLGYTYLFIRIEMNPLVYGIAWDEQSLRSWFPFLSSDLADGLGVEDIGLFSFKPSVRPVPLEVHIQGYPGKFYCPRMNCMNKPAYAAICTHSPSKPVLIFVSSRRQTRLTALDLIQHAASDEHPRQFLNMQEEDLEMVLSQVTDNNLRHTLRFGIGLHHAGLNDRDRSLVEELFANSKIQILVCTSTLAWGVNLPAHLVIIKGTEYFDGKTRRYVDFPITDILQMMGRAGRPQYDQHGKAVILVHEPKKSFYKKFLYEPFPVESNLREHLHDHINAEIVSGTISHKEDALHYLTWTYLFRRLVVNPAYYGLEDAESNTLNSYLSRLVQTTFEDLEDRGCIKMNEDSVEPLMLGSIASQYYLSYMTVSMFGSNISLDTSLEVFLHILSGASEYDELPVRHNEENFNATLSKMVPYLVDEHRLDDPHVKANLLFRAHFSRLELPISDYVTDLKSVLDQSIRIIQAMIDICANSGWLLSSLVCISFKWLRRVCGCLTLQDLLDVTDMKLQRLLQQSPASELYKPCRSKME